MSRITSILPLLAVCVFALAACGDKTTSTTDTFDGSTSSDTGGRADTANGNDTASSGDDLGDSGGDTRNDTGSRSDGGGDGSDTASDTGSSGDTGGDSGDTASDTGSSSDLGGDATDSISDGDDTNPGGDIDTSSIDADSGSDDASVEVDTVSPCQAGESSCVGDILRTCVGGAWFDVDCTLGGGTCSDASSPASCLFTGACGYGERRCVGDVLYQCFTNNDWSIVSDCAVGGGTCNDPGMPGYVIECRFPEVCTKDDTRCNGDVVETCLDQRFVWAETAWRVTADCSASGGTCVDTSGTPSCVLPTPPCQPGERRCVGNQLERCVDRRWVRERDCELSGLACRVGGNGAHCGTVCTDGATRCNGNRIQTCSSNTWADTTNCVLTNLETCDDSSGPPSCVAVACTPYESRCLGQTDAYCDSTGTHWRESVDCTEQGGVCAQLDTNWVDCVTPPECVDGDFMCVGGEVRSCIRGTWRASINCHDHGLDCNASAGGCVPPAICTDGATRCSSRRTQLCTGGVWVDGALCDPDVGMYCTLDSGIARCASTYPGTPCTPGPQPCRVFRDGYYVCSANGQKIDSFAMCGGMMTDDLCVDSGETPSRCLSQAPCSTSQTICSGSGGAFQPQRLICEQSGGWNSSEECRDAGQDCVVVNGIAQCGDCLDGQTRCDANVAQHCAGGAWVTDADCSATGQRCLLSEPLAACHPVPDWVPLVGGSYTMGSNETGFHPVTVPDFEIMRAEATLAEYQVCVNSGTCSSARNSGDPPNHPVELGLQDAAAYCTFIGARLPSEAEWEYAARSRGQDKLYPWGNAAPVCQRANHRSCTPPGTAQPLPVCSLRSGLTEDGLCDMGGNLAEWVADCWYPGYFGYPTDGSPRTGCEMYGGTVRGGGQTFQDTNPRTTSRRNGLGSEIGVRCVR